MLNNRADMERSPATKDASPNAPENPPVPLVETPQPHPETSDDMLAYIKSLLLSGWVRAFNARLNV